LGRSPVTRKPLHPARRKLLDTPLARGASAWAQWSTVPHGEGAARKRGAGCGLDLWEGNLVVPDRDAAPLSSDTLAR